MNRFSLGELLGGLLALVVFVTVTVVLPVYCLHTGDGPFNQWQALLGLSTFGLSAFLLVAVWLGSLGVPEPATNEPLSPRTREILAELEFRSTTADRRKGWRRMSPGGDLSTERLCEDPQTARNIARLMAAEEARRMS